MKRVYCDCMLGRMTRDLYEDPMYWLGAAFFYGFLFATWSWGIVYLILFLIIYEIFYFCYCRYKDRNDWDIMIRIGIVAGTIMGFLIGRNIIQKEDHNERFKEAYNKLFRDSK